MNASQASSKSSYEDDVVLAVNKPAGLVVHPTYKNATGRCSTCCGGRDDPAARFFLAGRLDKLTSGVVIAAKSQDAYVPVQRGWPEAVKDYLAVVHGCVEPECGEIDLRLGPDPSDRRRRHGSETSGAPSLTRFERLAYSDAAAGLPVAPSLPARDRPPSPDPRASGGARLAHRRRCGVRHVRARRCFRVRRCTRGGSSSRIPCRANDSD